MVGDLQCLVGGRLSPQYYRGVGGTILWTRKIVFIFIYISTHVLIWGVKLCEGSIKDIKDFVMFCCGVGLWIIIYTFREYLSLKADVLICNAGGNTWPVEILAWLILFVIDFLCVITIGCIAHGLAHMNLESCCKWNKTKD